MDTNLGITLYVECIRLLTHPQMVDTSLLEIKYHHEHTNLHPHSKYRGGNVKGDKGMTIL